MANKIDMNDQFSRMRQLMNYGLNESKAPSYRGVEYTKDACDGKTYGIIREGTKFYIKVANKKGSTLAENFDYIGGFRNRKDYEYDSFASAQKNFDLKLRSIAEAYESGKNIIVESWNPSKQEELTVEATDKMRKEIARERQIMENVSRIEGRKPQKSVNECGAGDPFCEDPDSEFKSAQKPNMKSKPDTSGDAKKANKEFKNASLKKTEIKEEEVLGWNRDNEDYMDKSHGTEVGDGAPFDDAMGRDIDDKEGTSTTGEMKHGVVEEEDAVMHNTDDQNKPEPGVSEVGDGQPFDGEKGREIDEAIDDFSADVIDGEDGEELDIDVDSDEAADEPEAEAEVDVDAEGDDLGSEEGAEAEHEENGIEDRLTALEDLMNKIASKLGVDKYEDDDLYDDSEDDAKEDSEPEENADDDVFSDEDETEIDIDSDNDDFESDDDEDEVFESKSYKKMMAESRRRKAVNEEGMKPFKDNGRVPNGNINKLDDFGKHPAYQKKVMSLPPKDMKEFDGYYDMNDDSVKNDMPYGEKIGDGAPFEISPETISNAIAESIKKILKKK